MIISKGFALGHMVHVAKLCGQCIAAAKKNSPANGVGVTRAMQAMGLHRA
ncbi:MULTISPECIES: hypothetical protein [Paraburkholderia]|jgi:hypothetical protein|uniref:Uncharacterized protein n=1 Tax=Paraburkholderia caribensis TaxID=75105 RepID=A0ABV0E9U8_9BURK|nr:MULTISPECIES: hypothetical protein [Paraburkholderia]